MLTWSKGHRLVDELLHKIMPALHQFMDNVLELARGQGVDINKESTTFFIGREKLVFGEKSKFSRWRANLFIFMSRNSDDAGSFFNLPGDQVIEVGVRLEI